jgi:capsule biosynthesis phosphatase
MDVDGTITLDKAAASYADAKPCWEVIEKLKQLKTSGYWIILNSSRNMRSYGGNIGLITKHTAPALIAWLERYEIPYDELHFGKPWCGHGGFYVDDRAIRPREFANLTIDGISQLIERDKFE